MEEPLLAYDNVHFLPYACRDRAFGIPRDVVDRCSVRREVSSMWS